jgi:hypothetical protein
VGSPNQIPTPLCYPPRQTPHPPHLKTGIVKWLHMRSTCSRSGAGGDRGRGESRPNPDSTPLSTSPNSSPSSSKHRNCQMVAHAHYMVSLRSRRRQGSRGVLTKPQLHYPPRQTPHPPHLKTEIAKYLQMGTTLSSLGPGGDPRPRGARTKPRLHFTYYLESHPNPAPKTRNRTLYTKHLSLLN